MFRVEKLNFIIGRHIILEDINFEVPEGGVLGIIGKSGAGKSSILRCLNLIQRPTSGAVHVGRVDICKLTPAELNSFRRKIGVVSQNYALLDRRTVYENVALPLKIHNRYTEESHNHIQKLLSIVGVIHKANDYPSKLSGGQKQRVAIARAIAQGVEVLLCDEFTSALDPKSAADIIKLLKSLNEQLGITIVFVTHDINVIKELATHVVVMDQGRVAEKGRVSGIFAKPKHVVTQSFIDKLTSVSLPSYLQITNEPEENSQILLKLKFNAKNSVKPVLANLIQEKKMLVNIVAGSLDHIGPEHFGNLVISVNAGDDEKTAMAFFADNGVELSKLGYVNWEKKNVA